MGLTTQDILDTVDASRRPLAASLVALADTKLVLGNWHTTCVLNAKSLPDYSALLAMGGAAFGHARALYDYLTAFGLEYALLERGRDAGAIHSQAVLDAPPEDWQDFVVTVYLADQICWLQAERYLSHPDRTLSGLARRIGEETYFHLKYATGWAAEFARDEASARRARDALLRRYPAALAWFPGDDGHAPAQRQACAKAAQDLLDILGQGGELGERADTQVHAADAPWRRRRPLPGRLYELVRFKDLEAVP